MFVSVSGCSLPATVSFRPSSSLQLLVLALIALRYRQLVMLASVDGYSLPTTYLHQSKCLLKHLFYLLVLALIAQHYRQVVHAHQCVSMLFAQHRLLQSECSSMHLFRLFVLALVAQHCR